MCINVCAYVPICKAVSHSLFWGKASENVKAEGAKRDLLCSLWSFAETECPGLNLTAKCHIIPYSWLKQAAYPFASLTYIIVHASSPHFFTKLWYSKQYHEDFPFLNLTIFVLAIQGICFIHHISHCNSSHSHCYSVVEINSIFFCASGISHQYLCITIKWARVPLILISLGGFIPVGTSGNIKLCDTTTRFSFRRFPPSFLKQPSPQQSSEARTVLFKPSTSPSSSWMKHCFSNLPIQASSKDIRLALQRQKETAKHYFLLGWFMYLSCPRGSEIRHHLSALYQLLCRGQYLQYITCSF